MITIKDLEESGYKKFKTTYKLSDYGYQKRITDNNGTKYFITVLIYDYNKEEYKHINGVYGKVSLCFDMQFYENKDIVNVQYSANEDTSLKQLEDKIERLWVHLGSPYYEKY